MAFQRSILTSLRKRAFRLDHPVIAKQCKRSGREQEGTGEKGSTPVHSRKLLDGTVTSLAQTVPLFECRSRFVEFCRAEVALQKPLPCGRIHPIAGHTVPIISVRAWDRDSNWWRWLCQGVVQAKSRHYGKEEKWGSTTGL